MLLSIKHFTEFSVGIVDRRNALFEHFSYII